MVSILPYELKPVMVIRTQGQGTSLDEKPDLLPVDDYKLAGMKRQESRTPHETMLSCFI
jgi:hypothetical protein